MSVRYRCESGLPPQRIYAERLNMHARRGLKRALHILRGL